MRRDGESEGEGGMEMGGDKKRGKERGAIVFGIEKYLREIWGN